VGVGSDDSTSGVVDRFESARLEFDAQAQRFEEAKSRLQTTVDTIRKGRPRREMLYHSTYARMQAKLDTMPVIEQAKGILMAQQRCGPEEAFDLLRRASQRANVKVHALAALIVARQAAQGSGGDALLPLPEVAVSRPNGGRS
jgi:hypothetical protein